METLNLFHITSLPLALLHNNTPNSEILPDIKQIFHVCQYNNVASVYLSLHNITDSLMRCAEQHDFQIYGMFDNVRPPSTFNFTSRVTIVGLGGVKTGKVLEELPYECPTLLINSVKPLDTNNNIKTNNSAMVYQYSYNGSLNIDICKSLDGVKNVCVFGLNNIQYPCINNFGMLDIHSFLQVINDVSYLICFDPLDMQLTPPQIYLSQNVLCLCPTGTDLEGVAPIPCFNSSAELQALIIKYSDIDLRQKKIQEIREALA